MQREIETLRGEMVDLRQEFTKALNHLPRTSISSSTSPSSLMSLKQAAQYLNVSRSTLHRYIKQGTIEVLRVGDSPRIRREWLEQYLQKDRYDAAAVAAEILRSTAPSAQPRRRRK